MIASVVDSDLLDWADVRDRYGWNALLLGNGASCAVWTRFRYRALFEEACRLPDAMLPAGAQGVFQAFETQNFETVLSSLSSARRVNECLKIVETETQATYELVREALISAVNSKHITWGTFNPARERIHSELLRYNWVFSTNYDLLLYWAIMLDQADFRDYFWSNPFDLADTEVWGKATRVLYLHGALHLEMRTDGATYKRTTELGDLLSTFGGSPTSFPLFVSEGRWQDKMRAIRASDYLSFAYSKLVEHEGPLVVFGHALSEAEDGHVARAIANSKSDPIAVSVFTTDGDAVLARKAALRQRLPGKNLVFFRSATHPLGDPSLLVDP